MADREKREGKMEIQKLVEINNVTLLCRFFESRVKEHLHKTFAMLSRFWPLREWGRLRENPLKKENLSQNSFFFSDNVE